MPRERQEELEAAVAVAETLGGIWVQRDVLGAPDGTHDFDIQVGERVIALEVTSSTDQEGTAFWNAVHDHEWLAPSLAFSWGLTLPGSTNVKKVQKRVARWLRTLETTDVLKFGYGYPTGPQAADVIEALNRLSDLGVSAGSAVDDPPSRIVVGVVGPSAWVGADSVSEAVEHEAAANAEKLTRAVADERHLFMWIDWTMSDLQAAVIGVLRLGIMPRVPELPDGVDAVWVAPRAMVDERQAFLWRVTPPGDWEVLDPSVLRGGRDR